MAGKATRLVVNMDKTIVDQLRTVSTTSGVSIVHLVTQAVREKLDTIRDTGVVATYTQSTTSTPEAPQRVHKPTLHKPVQAAHTEDDAEYLDEHDFDN